MSASSNAVEKMTAKKKLKKAVKKLSVRAAHDRKSIAQIQEEQKTYLPVGTTVSTIPDNEDAEYYKAIGSATGRVNRGFRKISKTRNEDELEDEMKYYSERLSGADVRRSVVDERLTESFQKKIDMDRNFARKVSGWGQESLQQTKNYLNENAEHFAQDRWYPRGRLSRPLTDMEGYTIKPQDATWVVNFARKAMGKNDGRKPGVSQEEFHIEKTQKKFTRRKTR
jgi:hypothetical protein